MGGVDSDNQKEYEQYDDGNSSMEQCMSILASVWRALKCITVTGLIIYYWRESCSHRNDLMGVVHEFCKYNLI